MVRGARFFAALLAGIFLVPQIPAQSATPPPGRFLFIFDTSSAMKARLPAMQTALDSLLATSLRGELRAGDSVAVWTFDLDLRTGQFPLQPWAPEKRPPFPPACAIFSASKNLRAARISRPWLRICNRSCKVRPIDRADFLRRIERHYRNALRRRDQSTFPAAAGGTEKIAPAVPRHPALAARSTRRRHDWFSAGTDGISRLSAVAGRRNQTGSAGCRAGTRGDFAAADHRRQNGEHQFAARARGGN